MMTRRDKHPSTDQLASLTVGEPRSLNVATIQAHVTRCEQCARVSQQLNAIPAILASAAYPPMPQNLSARTRSAISREAQVRERDTTISAGQRRGDAGLFAAE
jgi:hypothetical protein